MYTNIGHYRGGSVKIGNLTLSFKNIVEARMNIKGFESVLIP